MELIPHGAGHQAEEGVQAHRAGAPAGLLHHHVLVLQGDSDLAAARVSAVADIMRPPASGSRIPLSWSYYYFTGWDVHDSEPTASNSLMLDVMPGHSFRQDMRARAW